MSKKEKAPKEYNLHHILPGSQWWLTNETNCEMIRKTTHSALHTLFANQLIAEQLITTVNISSKALRPEVVERLLETLTAHDIDDLDFWYKRETHK